MVWKSTDKLMKG